MEKFASDIRKFTWLPTEYHDMPNPNLVLHISNEFTLNICTGVITLTSCLLCLTEMLVICQQFMADIPIPSQ